MTQFGQNLGYVDELYARYLQDPTSVSEAWREFFADYRPASPQPAPAPALAPRAAIPSAPPSPPAEADTAGAEPLRGAAARIVENMSASLRIPTATSARTIPVKLLEENRRVVNQHQAVVYGPRISFTHLIAWAIVRTLERHPAMNLGFVEVGGVPHRIPRGTIHLGVAIDVERKGERSLVVPNIKSAESLDFPSFVAAYDDLVSRSRRGQITVEELKGTTVTLTNPGMLGTALSVPRLMAGQGTIVGTGVIGYPAEYAGMAPDVIASLGLSKVMTVTSTYDHRIIQGAESGAFLSTLEELILGQHGFYERIFADLRVPHEPVPWAGDQNPQGAWGAPGSTEAIEKQAGVLQLIRAHRVRGHLLADLDPLGYHPQAQPELELSTYGLTLWDLDRRFIAGGLAGNAGMVTLRAIVDILRETYCRNVGVEYYHIQDPEIRHWLQERMETTRNATPLPRDRQMRILMKLNAAEAFEKFLHTAYLGQKRFSLEGAETLIPMLEALLDEAGLLGVQDAVIGMSHRGRLNVTANVVGSSYDAIFREFEGDLDPVTTYGSGDVKYHLGASGTYTTESGTPITLTLAPNPSHLEAVNPVVEGMVRARQDRILDTAREKVLPILLHGDAAFAGQGVVAETLNLSQLKGYRTGGTIHIVVNNQIGFTTSPTDARSSTYATDVARTVQAPIFHVNADRPEDAVRVIQLALHFRHAFKRDVVVDLVCYRRWGHNEADDPSYTNPILYNRIERHRSVRKRYTEELLRRGDLDPETAERVLNDYRQRLERAFEEVRRAKQPLAETPVRPETEEAEGAARPPVSTAVPRRVLETVLDGLERLPDGFEIHPKLAKQLARRREQFEGGRIDWGLGEALAFGSLVLQGIPVRLSGEDSGRGTFSQRHAILYDFRSEKPHVPLAALAPDQAPFQALNSHLSEFAVMGFEYGYSVDAPEALVMWEAQFGDFANGGQVIIDQFITSAEEKWGIKNRLVLLLPHGHEGQGPEHSSARVERFLQLAARGNIQVCQPSTPAQYFHLLRRQVLREEVKPLIVLTPKSLLRLKESSSTAEELTNGTFEDVLDDPESGSLSGVRRVVLTTSKVYFEIEAARRERGSVDIALLRLEQFYPFPGERISALLRRYPEAKDVVWVQEEPRNMGAFGFLLDRVAPCLAPGQTLRYVGRPRNPSPATGSTRRHLAEQKALSDAALSGEPAAVTISKLST